jgi:hypothetical protein
VNVEQCQVFEQGQLTGLQRPMLNAVKIMHTRDEEFSTSCGREPLITCFKTG